MRLDHSTNVIKRHCLQQITGTLQRYLRHKLLCIHISDGVEFVAKDLSCLTEILELQKGAILRFNNRNLNFNPLSTKISNKNFRFIGTLNIHFVCPQVFYELLQPCICLIVFYSHVVKYIDLNDNTNY